MTNSTASKAEADLDTLIADPPREFSPTPLWWWSGEKVTRERVRWQLEKFAAGGIYGVVIINLAPAGPLVGAQTDDPAWFSDEWWARFEDACEAAEELGMKIWFYDQIGFSGANVQGRLTSQHPRAAGSALKMHQTSVIAGLAQIPPDEQILAAFSSGGSRVALDVQGRSDLPDGTTVMAVTTVPTAFDYLNPDACTLLRDSIHGEFERRLSRYFDTVIAGSFQDELPATNSWTSRFPEEFRTRKGYDLLDELPSLWSREGDRAKKVRGDYYSVRAQLAEEAFFRPLGEWHSERGMIVGSDQSNPARAGNPTQATQIYTDYFRTHRWYGGAGSDHEGDSKLHSSLAHLYGHEKVWIEAFHSSGWGGTLEETWDWLIPFLRSGANLYNPHATYYSTRARWFEWAPPSTDWRQPYWAQYPEFSRAVRRVASVCSWGRFVTATAVLHPTANAQAMLPLDLPIDHFGRGDVGEGFDGLDAAQRTYLSLVGANNWFHTRLGELDRAGVSFDIVDDDSIHRSIVESSHLRIANATYRTVIVPAVTVLEDATAEQLIRLLDKGGRVVMVGHGPRLAAGLDGDDLAVLELVAHPRVEFAPDAEAAVAAVGTSGEYVHSDVPVLARRLGDDVVTFVPGATPSATAYPLREWEGPWLWNDINFDRSRYAPHRDIRVDGPVSEVEAIDAATGEHLRARVDHTTGTRTTIRVDTGGSPGILVRWRASEGDESAPEEPPACQVQPVLTSWRGKLVPTLDNRWGDFGLPAGKDLSDLEVWDVEIESGGAWVPARVTVGEQLLAIVRPVDALAALTESEARELCAGRRDFPRDGWVVAEYSTATGPVNQPGLLGRKGLVLEEFVEVAGPASGEESIVRTLVEVAPGEYDLVVSAAAPKTVYWNGREVGVGDGYSRIARVTANTVNVLEYRTGPYDPPGPQSLDAVTTIRSAFQLVEPGGFGERPEFMTSGFDFVPTAPSTFSKSVTVPAGASSARLIVGAATGVEVVVDGTVVARQEKVEYYEAVWSATPMFFEHDLLAHVGAGTHSISIVSDSRDQRDVVYVDLVIDTPSGRVVLVSGAGWQVSSGDDCSRSEEHRGHWSELLASHAAVRTHPLRGAAWLNGEVAIGKPSAAVHARISLQSEFQRVRAMLPAGTKRVAIPVTALKDVKLAGRVPLVQGTNVVFDPPLEASAAIEFVTESGYRGGALDGPLLVGVEPAKIELRDWQDIGLGSWSGGIEYSTTVELGDEPLEHVLHLGAVRGSVSVTIDGALVGSRFCAPWSIPIGLRSGRTEVTVTVFNTLAPFFLASTTTTWTFPSQLSSGLFGPVTVSVTQV